MKLGVTSTTLADIRDGYSGGHATVISSRVMLGMCIAIISSFGIYMGYLF